MSFHTDYMVDRSHEEGHKFAITTTMYINDDYEHGAIVFRINGKTFSYKPKAGDVLVFPSGHPLLLMEGETPLMHAVEAIPYGGPDRYMVRMFHQIYSKGENLVEILNSVKNNSEEL